MKGDWALQEWYPNYRKKASTSEGGDEEEADSKDAAEPKEQKTATA
jgi:hypothetical protein